MQTYKCVDCEFTFTEADKAWRDAIDTWQCPKCLKKLYDFPPGTQRMKEPAMTEQAEIAIAKPAVDYEIALMAIPVVATMLIWFWVSGMNLFQSPGNSMALIMLATILGTAIVAAMEASKVGMKSDRSKGTYSPTAWFFIITFLWIIGYPMYLFKRKHFGLANRLLAGILIALIFLGSWSVMNSAIEAKKTEVRGNLEQMQQQLKSLGR